MGTSQAADAPRDAAHRAALDHVLGLIADAPWSAGLILRGSMAMTAWVGPAAREPADLDWIVVGGATPIDPQDPYPFVDLETVQQWPEAADGALAEDLWAEQEFETGGQRPRTPPDGLRWIDSSYLETGNPPYEDLIELVRQAPEAALGVVLDADRAREDGIWAYTDYDSPGVRLVIPWRRTAEAGSASGLESGEVRLDFARDETLPEAPVWTRVPRGDGGFTVVRTASRELSLAWKLLWLHTDAEDEGLARGKDLYDAVVLAETEGVLLSPRLLAKVVRNAGRDLAFRPVRADDVDWEGFIAEYPWVEGTADVWRARLTRALAAMAATLEAAGGAEGVDSLRGKGSSPSRSTP